MHKTKTRLTALLLALTIALPTGASASVALGDDLHASTLPMAPGLTLTEEKFWSNTYRDLRTERYFTYTPSATVSPMIVTGDTVLARQTLTKMAQSLESQGYTVAGGINGDFYDVATGNPLGLIVQEGQLVSSPSWFEAIGFLPDGTAIIGKPNLSLSATFRGNTWRITDINKTRTAYSNGNPGGFYLYTDQFHTTTAHSSPGIDVILSPLTDNLGTPITVHPDDATEISGQDEIDPMDGGAEAVQSVLRSDKLAIGTQVTCVVEQVLQSTTAIEIPEGKLVLTLNKVNDAWPLEELSALVPGDFVDITVTAADPKWNEVETALGGFYRILTDGTVGPNVDTTANPRSAIGIKADGTVVFYTIDGRQSSYSVGASLSQVANRLLELGCVNAIGLDGGGSATLGGTLPGSDGFTLLNQPSGGSERAVTNGIFFVSQPEATGTASHTAVSPYQSIALSGAQIDHSYQLFDTGYQPMTSHQTAQWSVTGDSAVDGSGTFTAGHDSGTVHLSATVGDATGQAAITVVNTPDTLKICKEGTTATVTQLALSPGQEIALTAQTTYRNLSLIAQDTCFVWTADPHIGTVDENGTFIAGDVSGTGNLTVSAGSRTVQIPVTVTGQIAPLDDFEADNLSFLLSTDTVTATPNQATVRYGNQSVQLDYQHIDGTATLRTSYDLPADQRYVSLWLYGDGTGQALSGTISDGDGISHQITFGTVDFVGWKHCIAKLPKNASSLTSLTLTAGYLGNATGTLWLDHLTTADEALTDTVSPTLTLTPGSDSLQVALTDNIDASFHAYQLLVTLDGEPHHFQWKSETSTATVTLPQEDGHHHRLAFTLIDHSGNRTSATYRIAPQTPAANPFLDMDGHWASDFTSYLYDRGTVNGMETAEGFLYQPDDSLTRDQCALMLARWLGADLTAYDDVTLPFVDVNDIPDWALSGVKAMYSLGIMQGSQESDGLYALANQPIKRAEVMTLLGRMQAKGYATERLTFTDSSDVPTWALPHVETLVAQGVINGYDGYLRPNDPIKRSEIAKILYVIER